ncbi:MAG TPA: phage late control D family protein, partial [Candidatus Nanopelagicales bacterium]|nr:phage late control D family protein [Candidatus Nanopelagicales bacterium]
MTLDAFFRLEADGLEGFRIHRARGTESVHGTFRVEIEGAPEHAAGERGDRGERGELDAEALLGQPATLVLGAGGDRERRIAGVIDRVEAAFAAHRLVLVPRLAALADAVDHQVFLDQDAVAIALGVLGEHGVEVESRVTRKLPKRPQCVQA